MAIVNKTGVKIPEHVVDDFVQTFKPIEKDTYIFLDARTEAIYCECHVYAKTLLDHSTTDVPLDPDDQPEYRANREVVTDHGAFEKMKEDAENGRSFSNIVAEFTRDFDGDSPLKIIGGQHRYESIKAAYDLKRNELHGIKVYFDLDQKQRLDVQLVSNTVIAVSADLLDRMQETMRGPELRKWCQTVGFLEPDEDFADRRTRGGRITVGLARAFIINFYRGKSLAKKEFDKVETTPFLPKAGTTGTPEWDSVRANKDIWKDQALIKAGKEFCQLATAQRQSVKTKAVGGADKKEKAFNYAILTAWAFTAGILQDNPKRLQRHYDIKTKTSKDPLVSDLLAKGRHSTDPENYRGLGYRTDAKERGRFVELFYEQAIKGEGITKNLIDLAIKKYHAKHSFLEVEAARSKT